METIQTRTIHPYELEGTAIISPEHSLRVALGKIQKKSTVKPIYTSCPTLEETTRKLARILTHEYPLGDGTNDVLSCSIRKAIDAYESASTTAIVESDLADAYLKALCDEAAALIGFDVHGMWESGKTERWEHLSMPLIDWAKKKRLERVVFTPRNGAINPSEHKAAKFLVACQILSVRDMTRLFQS